MMDSSPDSFVANVLANLAAKVIQGSAGWLKEKLSTPEKEKALGACLRSGLVALYANAAENTLQEHLNVLGDIFREYFRHDDVAVEIGQLLRGRKPDRRELLFLFEEAGFDTETLPGLDFDQALNAFEAAFLEEAIAQGAFRDIIDTQAALDQLNTLRDILDVLKPGSDGEPFYLKTLVKLCDPLDLALMHESRSHMAGRDPGNAVKISDVFTRLFLSNMYYPPNSTLEDLTSTLTGGHQEFIAKLHRMNSGQGSQLSIQEEGKLFRQTESSDKTPVQAVEAIAAAKRLVILGQPGGGKSSLVNHLVVLMSKRRLGQQVDSEKLPGWQKDESPLPVRIILRRFAAWLPEKIPHHKAGLVWDYLKHQLAECGCAEYYTSLKHTLTHEGGILFFDGLDEVSSTDAENKRSLIVETIKAFAAPLDDCRVIITCREYAYKTDDAWRLPEVEYPVVELALFEAEQMENFCHTWYQVVGPQKQWTKMQATREADYLFAAIKSEAHLRELARYPLLITLMAEVHGSEGRLPEDRADLYERAVELLLVHWESRIIRETSQAREIQKGLLSELGVDRTTLRDVLQRVAFSTHERQEKEKKRDERAGDISREDLRDELEAELHSLDKAQVCIDYIQERAGLLLARDNRTYAFPHRTFQEYLTAAYIAKQSDFVSMLQERLDRDFNWWQEVFLLTAGIARAVPLNIANLVNGILPGGPKKNRISEKSQQLAVLAARALWETRFADQVRKEKIGGLYGKTLKHIQNWLLKAIDSPKSLNASLRVSAGNALGRLGDPRLSVISVDKMEFCYVPGGAFYMGSEADDDEKPQHLNETVRRHCWVARYPVTSSQYHQFLTDRDGSSIDAGSIANTLTHPVVSITWYDAVQFCEWLNERWSRRGLLPDDCRVMLPSEAQWEKAARGGLQIPKKPVLYPIDKLRSTPDIELIKNPRPKRRYPWGSEANPNRANYSDTGINGTSPVGCFADGAGPFGCEEMSGNVWEWTRSLRQQYPYKPDDGREDMAASKELARVVRGGSFLIHHYVRCSIRGRDNPGDRYFNFGFRVVVSP